MPFKTIIAFFFLSVFYLKCLLAKRLLLLAARQVNLAFLLKLPYVLFRNFLAILFETIAYNHGAACGSGTHGFGCHLCPIFGRFILKESIYIHSLIGTLLAVAGISIISWKGENSLLMLINASIAGTGYGLFSVLVKSSN